MMHLGPWRHRPYCAAGTCDLCDNTYVGYPWMKMPIRPESGSQVQTVAEPSTLFKKLAAFGDWLVNPCWEGSSDPKGERSIWMVTGGTFTKLLLKVEALGIKMMVQGRSVDEAFAAAELALKSENPPWEFPPPPKPKGAKKSA